LISLKRGPLDQKRVKDWPFVGAETPLLGMPPRKFPHNVADKTFRNAKKQQGVRSRCIADFAFPKPRSQAARG